MPVLDRSKEIVLGRELPAVTDLAKQRQANKKCRMSSMGGQDFTASRERAFRRIVESERNDRDGQVEQDLSSTEPIGHRAAVPRGSAVKWTVHRSLWSVSTHDATRFRRPGSLCRGMVSIGAN